MNLKGIEPYKAVMSPQKDAARNGITLRFMPASYSGVRCSKLTEIGDEIK